MDEGGQWESGRHRMDFFKGVHTPWNMFPQYQMKEANAIFMNKKILQIIAEKDNAIEELNRAISEKNAALEEQNEALKQRDDAIAAWDTAIQERGSAIAALRFQESSMNGTLGYGIPRGTKRMHHSTNHASVAEAAYNNAREMVQITNAFPVTLVPSETVKSRQPKHTKENNKAGASSSKVSKSPRKGKKVGEDLNRHVTTDGLKAEWDARNLINQISFDESTMPARLFLHRKASTVLQMGERRLAIRLLHHHPVQIPAAPDAEQAPCSDEWPENEQQRVYQAAESTRRRRP